MNDLIEGNTMDELYVRLCQNLIYNYDVRYPDESKLYSELLDTTCVLKSPEYSMVTLKERNLSYRYLFGEFAFYMKGSDRLKDINKYSKFWNKISDDGKTVNSAYGYKLFEYHRNGPSQYEYAIRQLIKNKYSKRAVMLINTPVNTVIDTKDTPCTMYIQYFIRNNRLYCINNMRSNDIFFGTPYDISFFSTLQILTAYSLLETYPGLGLGTYTHKAGSLHVYKKDVEKIKKVSGLDVYDISRKWNNPFPSITMNTLKQLDLFVSSEESGKVDEGITDPYLLTALRIIKGENK